MKERDPHGKAPNAPGAKLDAGKVQAGLLLDFSRALEAVADVATHGAAKYSPGGWLKVFDGQRRYTDAMLRHLLADAQAGGNSFDPDSLLRHAAHTAWNALAVLELALRDVEREQIERNSFKALRKAHSHALSPEDPS